MIQSCDSSCEGYLAKHGRNWNAELWDKLAQRVEILYHPLQTVADLVMPWFLFLMGTSMTFSLDSMRQKNLTNLQIFQRLLTRAGKLMILGLFVINKNTDFKTFRIPGVLQRFFVCYLAVGLIHSFLRPKLENRAQWSIDFVPFWHQWLIITIIGIIWLGITFFLPVPGFFQQ